MEQNCWRLLTHDSPECYTFFEYCLRNDESTCHSTDLYFTSTRDAEFPCSRDYHLGYNCYKLNKIDSFKYGVKYVFKNVLSAHQTQSTRLDIALVFPCAECEKDTFIQVYDAYLVTILDSKGQPIRALTCKCPKCNRTNYLVFVKKPVDRFYLK